MRNLVLNETFLNMLTEHAIDLAVLVSNRKTATFSNGYDEVWVSSLNNTLRQLSEMYNENLG